MKLALSLLVLALAGCTTERQQQSGWTLHVVDGPCAPAEQARPALLEAWGKPATDIDGMSCSLDQIQSIAEPEATAEQSCCYPTRCDGELSPAEQLALFDASCSSLACRDVTLSAFSPDAVAGRLAASLPRCSLQAPDAKAADRDTLRCVYTVNASYTCSTAPG